MTNKDLKEAWDKFVEQADELEPESEKNIEKFIRLIEDFCSKVGLDPEDFIKRIYAESFERILNEQSKDGTKYSVELEDALDKDGNPAYNVKVNKV